MSDNADQIAKRKPAKPLPDLMAIASGSGHGNAKGNATTNKTFANAESGNGSPNETDDEMMAAQIRINAEALKEIEELRRQRYELLANVDKSEKEKAFMKAKLMQTNDQLQYLKKKFGKVANNKVENAENADPNIHAKASKNIRKSV